MDQALRAHQINLADYVRRHSPKFFLEREPGKRWTCHLPLCAGDVNCSYRVALIPPRGAPRVTYYYHVDCFESAINTANPLFLSRIDVVTPHTYDQRGLSPKQVQDGKYFCDAGGHQLISEWVRLRGQAVAAQSQSPQLLQAYTVQDATTPFDYGTVDPGTGMAEYTIDPAALEMLPPPPDPEPTPPAWDLIAIYLDLGTTDLADQHSLSRTLRFWDEDKRYMFFGDRERPLGPLTKEAKERIRQLARVTFGESSGGGGGLGGPGQHHGNDDDGFYATESPVPAV